MKRLTFDGDFCDIAMCREELGGPFCEEGYCSQRKVWERLKAYEDTGLEPEDITRAFDETTILQLAGSVLGMSPDRLRELAKADREGRCVVLPIELGRTLLDTSDPYRPELMKDFRISAAWTHNGIVFYSPWDIFLGNIEKGYIRVMSKEAEAALREAEPSGT